VRTPGPRLPLRFAFSLVVTAGGSAGSPRAVGTDLRAGDPEALALIVGEALPVRGFTFFGPPERRPAALRPGLVPSGAIRTGQVKRCRTRSCLRCSGGL